MTRKTYTGKNVSASGPYAHVVDAGDYLFFSGQTAYNGINYIGEKYEIKRQTEKCFEHLKDVMTEAQVTLADIVKVNVYLTSMAYFDEMNEVYQKMFTAPFPARTCVAVFGLPLEADVEIECIVKKPKARL